MAVDMIGTQAIGGTFEIETEAGAGTRITVKVPA